MDYHITQMQLHCRVCARRLLKAKSKCPSTIFLCKAHVAKLLNAFGIDTNNDDNRVHPEHFCPSCKRALDRGDQCHAQENSLQMWHCPLSVGDAFRPGMQGRCTHVPT